jgi:hypothetical protein
MGRDLPILGRWLSLVPFMMAVLLASAQVGTSSAQVPTSADTSSKVRADYSPWEPLVIHPVDQGILEVISQDRAAFPEPEADATGTLDEEFWPTAPAVPSSTALPERVTPYPPPNGTPTYTVAPLATSTLDLFPTSTPKHSDPSAPTKTAKHDKSPTPTPYPTPYATKTPSPWVFPTVEPTWIEPSWPTAPSQPKPTFIIDPPEI